MTDGRDHGIKVKLHQHLLADGPLTLLELCERVILHSGPSAYPLPEAYGRPLLKQLQQVGLVDVLKGRPLKFTGGWGYKPPLPVGYLYEKYWGCRVPDTDPPNYEETNYTWICCPQWGKQTQVHVFLKDGQVECSLGYYTKDGKHLALAASAAALGLSVTVIPPRWGDLTAGLRFQAPLADLEKLAGFLGETSYH